MTWKEGCSLVRWNLRLVAASRGIWKASELHYLLTESGLQISTGKMSNLWSGQPRSVKLADLQVICEVLRCEVGELLVIEESLNGHEMKSRSPVPVSRGDLA